MYKDLILGMLQAGIFGFGGGPSVIPLFRHEAVTKYKWMANDEFGDALAIANTLPGPIATKLAAYIGYHQKGIIGAIISVIVHILPTCLAMVFLFSFISILSHSPIITSMIGAVVPVIAVMLGLMAYELEKRRSRIRNLCWNWINTCLPSIATSIFHTSRYCCTYFSYLWSIPF